MALIKCRGCGRDISDKEEKCPNCGRPITNTKRYQQFYKPAELHPADDTPQEPKHNYQVSYYQEPPKRQKPKRGSALAVVSLMVSIISCTFSVMAIIAVGNMSNSIKREMASVIASSQKAAQEAEETENVPKEAPTPAPYEPEDRVSANKQYSLGDTWTVDGQWALTVNSISATSQRNEHEVKNPAQVFVIDYTYENLGYEDEDGLMDGLYFDLSSGQIVDHNSSMGYSYALNVDDFPQETPVGASCQAQACIGVDHESTEIKIIVSKYDGNHNHQKAPFLLSVPEDTASQENGEKGVLGIEAKKGDEADILADFSYKITGDKIILETYTGESQTLEILSAYRIDGEDYETDLSKFQAGNRDSSVKTLIIEEGITEVHTSIFHSCSIQKVFFPKSINNIYDRTLSYLQPKGNDTIKIYYGGTQEEWSDIFTEYQKTEEEDPETVSANEIGELPENEYDSSMFEYFFSASPDSLK